MRVPGLFRTPGHQQFVYKPRFYDADKEELQGRIDRAKKRYDANDPDSMKDRISYGLRRGGGDQGLRRKAVLRSNITVFIISVCLLMIALIFVYYYLDVILAYLDD